MAKYIKTEEGYKSVEEIGGIATIESVSIAQETADSKMDANNPVGTGSFSMNRKSNTTIGNYSHAEGNDTTASGKYSHAEGFATIASNQQSHAEGAYTRASGYNAHAEGFSTIASGYYSHAEGFSTIASNSNSHAEGAYTIAASYNQHVQGKHNIEDAENKYAHIVGNGKSEIINGTLNNNERSNAHTLDWQGNAWFAGDVYVGSTSGTNKDEGSVKLQKSITGTPGQFVVIGDDGNVTTKTIAIAEEASF